MTDLREKVKEDRGLLKKIEMAIPGFRGYRKREDLRIADSLLRKQLADRLKNIGKKVERLREEAARKADMDLLNIAGPLINKADALEAKVRHAPQGYTGISPDYRLEEEELNALYGFDWDLITGVKHLEEMAEKAVKAAAAGDPPEIRSAVSDIRQGMESFSELFDKRIEKIAGMEAFE